MCSLERRPRPHSCVCSQTNLNTYPKYLAGFIVAHRRNVEQFVFDEDVHIQQEVGMAGEFV